LCLVGWFVHILDPGLQVVHTDYRILCIVCVRFEMATMGPGGILFFCKFVFSPIFFFSPNSFFLPPLLYNLKIDDDVESSYIHMNQGSLSASLAV